ncbi:hypothetical protein, partial [Streptomyces palmae]|uniref:hypothetical protein n=1 Tax=Streptomyces palmae TaxID=1701085 RepID=UPI001AE032CC
MIEITSPRTRFVCNLFRALMVMYVQKHGPVRAFHAPAFPDRCCTFAARTDPEEVSMKLRRAL